MDREYRAELHLVGGRLMRGARYESAPRETRYQLARVGAMLKLRERNRYHVHAAGVVAPDGRAWMLTGESGNGKSTLTYALARRGWPVLGDDGIVLERRASEVLAYAWREPLQVSFDLAVWFPELHDHATAVDWQDARHRVGMEATLVRSAPVAGVIVLSRGERDHLSPLSPTSALTMLIRQSTFLLLTDNHAAANLATLRQVVESVPCFGLEHTPAQLSSIDSTILAAAG
jgi:energy-coupling factor transporter ATP-binding protein EcfA2